MIEFINDSIKQLQKEEKTQLKCLSRSGGLSTDWALNQSSSNPGFFTPFNKKMGIKQAVIATGLLPALKLQAALSTMLLIPTHLFASIVDLINGRWENACDNALSGLVKLPTAAIYFSGAFILNLLKEITALITRSIATLVDMCRGSNKEPIEFAGYLKDESRPHIHASFNKNEAFEAFDAFHTSEAFVSLKAAFEANDRDFYDAEDLIPTPRYNPASPFGI